MNYHAVTLLLVIIASLTLVSKIWGALQFLLGVLILPFSFAVAERCARLRETLKSQNKRVNSRALDLIIAATALEYNLTLVTKNTDDFKDIPDLPLSQPCYR
jgi:predicted nucleic acid-binding protein